jgi:hypothetical protein
MPVKDGGIVLLDERRLIGRQGRLEQLANGLNLFEGSYQLSAFGFC